MMTRDALHGTAAAEGRHRRNGTWPCRECLAVRADVEHQMFARYRVQVIPPSVFAALEQLARWTWWNEGERLDVCRECARIAGDVAEFARLVGLPVDVARPLMRWLVVREESEEAPNGHALGAA